MPSIVTVPTLDSGDVISEAFLDAVKDDVNYLTVAGADLPSAATVTVTNEFHKVTGTTTIDNISHAAPVAGQCVRLWFTGALAIRNQGGGTGNIRTQSGTDLAVTANQIATFFYDGTTWRELRSITTITTSYRKTTPKTVNTSTATTDLLNGEVTIAAGAVPATGCLRLSAFGDFKQNSGGTTNMFRFQLVFGGTTIFDTGAPAFALANSATRLGWRLDATIQNTATGAQVCYVVFTSSILSSSAAVAAALTTGEGNFLLYTGGSATSLCRAEGYLAAAVDTTAAKALVLNVINPSANAACESVLASALVTID